MEPFKSILVDVDASVPAHPALERAARLARNAGARLTVSGVLTLPPYGRKDLPANIEQDMANRHRQQLEDLARAVEGVQTEAKLLVGRPGTVLVQEVLRSRHDLLMRSHARDVAAPAAKPFGAIDMELMRKCPCPVFLVRQDGAVRYPQIVGAVNASTEDATERALNIKIVELTLLMARLEGGSAVLLQAWAPFAERLVRSHSSDDAFHAYVEDVRRRSAEDLAQLTRSFGDRLAGVPATSRRGAAEDVVPEFAAAQGVDLVVMGTVARAGIAGILIGNTAERMLRKMPCSVLAVKPDGFVSPVRVDTSRR